MKRILVLVNVMLLLGVSAYGDTITLWGPSECEDVELSQAKPDEADYGNTLTVSGSTTSGGKVLLRFPNVDSLIPAGATVDSATLSFTYTTAQGAHSLYVSQILVPWVEGPPAWAGRLTGATWNDPDGDLTTYTAWPGAAGMQAGVDYASTPADTQTTGAWTSKAMVYDLTALVQAWDNGTATNYGVVVTESATNKNGWLTSNDGDKSHHGSELVIEYEVAVPIPEPGTMLLFGTGLVGTLGVWRRRRTN